MSAFAALGDSLRPKSFAGLFGAAPSIALATLLITLSHKRRLDVVERDQVSGRRSIGLGVADEFGHAGFNPPIVRDFKLGREARERDSDEPMVAETKHMIKVYHIPFLRSLIAAGAGTDHRHDFVKLGNLCPAHVGDASAAKRSRSLIVRP